MAVQLFWDANFKVKSLEPVLEDVAGQASPVTLASAASLNMELDADTKSVVIKKDSSQTNNKIKVKVSKTPSPGPPVAEPGEFIHDLSSGDLTITTDNLTYLIIINQEGSNRDYPFVLYKAL